MQAPWPNPSPKEDTMAATQVRTIPFPRTCPVSQVPFPVDDITLGSGFQGPELFGKLQFSPKSSVGSSEVGSWANQELWGLDTSVLLH